MSENQLDDEDMDSPKMIELSESDFLNSPLPIPWGLCAESLNEDESIMWLWYLLMSYASQLDITLNTTSQIIFNISIQSLSLWQFHPAIPNILWYHPARLVLVLLHPLMPLDVLQTHSLGWIAIENFAYEVYDLGREVDWELNVYLQDLVVCLVLVSIGFKGSLTSTQLIAKYS